MSESNESFSLLTYTIKTYDVLKKSHISRGTALVVNVEEAIPK